MERKNPEKFKEISKLNMRKYDGWKIIQKIYILIYIL